MKFRQILGFLMLGAALIMMSIASMNAQENLPRLWISSAVQHVSAGEEFTVEVNVADAVGIFGSSLKLSYDSQILEVVTTSSQAIVPGDFFKGQTGFTLVNTANPQENTIEYAMTLTQPAEPVTGSGTLGTITFRALSDGAVDIVPVEVRLLSPKFTEVDGHKIARQVNEIAAGGQGITIGVGSSASALAAAPESQPELPARPAPLVSSRSATLPVLIVGTILFVVGLALFMTSVGAYVKLRREFSLQEPSEQIVW